MFSSIAVLAHVCFLLIVSCGGYGLYTARSSSLCMIATVAVRKALIVSSFRDIKVLNLTGREGGYT